MIRTAKPLHHRHRFPWLAIALTGALVLSMSCSQTPSTAQSAAHGADTRTAKTSSTAIISHTAVPTPAAASMISSFPPTPTVKPHTPPAPATLSFAFWNGQQLAVQADTAVVLPLPQAPAGAQHSQLTVHIAGWPNAASLTMDSVRIQIPSNAIGIHRVVLHWQHGESASIRLQVAPMLLLNQHLGMPDDLTLAPDGSIIFSNLQTGSVERLSNDAPPTVLVSGLHTPEGVAIQADGALIIAEQGTNRILSWRNGHGEHVLAQLPRPRGATGIDGLSITASTLLLPDSANGFLYFLLLRMSPVLRQQPSHWLRPTDAVLWHTTVYLIDEYGGQLWTGQRGSALVPRGPKLTLPDDVVIGPHGTAYINELGGSTSNGAVVAIHRDGTMTTLLRHLHSPQGLAIDGADNLMLSQTASGSIGVFLQSCWPLFLGSQRITPQEQEPSPIALAVGSDCVEGNTPLHFDVIRTPLWPPPATESRTAIPSSPAIVHSMDGSAIILLAYEKSVAGTQLVLTLHTDKGVAQVPLA